MFKFKLNWFKWSRPTSAFNRGVNCKTKLVNPGSQNKKFQNHPSTLMWASGKIVTTILPALICGIGLGIAIGHWLDPTNEYPPVNFGLKNSAKKPPIQKQLIRTQTKHQISHPSVTISNVVSELTPVITDPPELSELTRFIEQEPSIAAMTNVLPLAEGASQVEKNLGTRPQWLDNAVMSSAAVGMPIIALVIDDVGVDQKRSKSAISLSGPLTIAVMTYARNIRALTAAVRRNGHELIVHVPMEPFGLDADAGPNALLISLDENEIMRRLNWALTRFDGYVGISNHMGSRFSTFEPGIRSVLEEIHKRGLLYLDSRTTANSLAEPVARSLGMPYATRDVFLDNDPTPAAIRRQIVELEELAMRHGYSVGIGHPYDATIQVLRDWLPRLNKRGFVLVPISEIVRRRLAGT